MVTTMHTVRQHLNEVKDAHESHIVVDAAGHRDTLCRTCSMPWPCDVLKEALRATAAATDLPPTAPPPAPTSREFDQIDADYRATVELVAGDWLHGDEDMARFVAVLMDCRRGPLDLISQNDVRTRLLEPTAKGLRCAIEHHRFSAMYSRARKEGLIARHKGDDGRVATDICKTSPTGNNGRLQVIYRWTGKAS